MSLAIDRDSFNTHFARTPFLVPHRLARHTLLTLPCLVELAKRLPASQVEYNAGEVPVGLDPARTPRNGLSPEETIRRIAECRSWLVLKHVEHDPSYRLLLDHCLAGVRGTSARLTAGMREPHAFIFVSSPGAITPYHMDPEENFLLQIRGTKTISVFDRARALLGRRAPQPHLARGVPGKGARVQPHAGPGASHPVRRAALGAERPRGLDLLQHHLQHARFDADLARPPAERPAAALGRGAGPGRPLGAARRGEAARLEGRRVAGEVGRPAQTLGSATPTSVSRVRIEASCSSSQPSVPFGRIGTTT
jgi:hypothetical protein